MAKLLFLITALIAIGVFIFTFNALRAPGVSDEVEIVIIDSERADTAAIALEEKGFIKSFNAFNILLVLSGNSKIKPGGYYLSKNMNAWEILNKLKRGPDLVRITLREGLRKEQIGEELAKALGWNGEKQREWNNVYSSSDEYKEGVYFPDTYLIPVNNSPQQIADRMIANFNERFAPYLEDATNQNIKWTTVIKIASLIEREAAGPEDMSLIAGIMWNRLNEGQKLDIDATIQYAKGKTGGLWWSKVTGKDIRDIDSLYNTYKYKGLPPTPISNPGLSAIKAVLNPEETDCFYYLHAGGKIYCSKTYEEHLDNIEKYL